MIKQILAALTDREFWTDAVPAGIAFWIVVILMLMIPLGVE